MNERLRYHHYEVEKRADGSLFELGSGAMGITYKGINTNLESPVVIKVIRPEAMSPSAYKRFVREAKAAAGLRHPNVAAVYELSRTDEGIPFLVMEFIEGENLHNAVVSRGGPFGPAEALQITSQVASALSAVNRRGLVHRDIKPGNLMLTREHDDEIMVKVIDFGIVKIVEELGAGTLAGADVTAHFVGTGAYASPEQFEQKPLTIKSDVYALGVTLWFLLTGRELFSGTFIQLAEQHLKQEPPFEELADLSESIRDLLRQMLLKDPEQRPSPLQVRRAIGAILGTASDTTLRSSDSASKVLKPLSSLTARGERQPGEPMRATDSESGREVSIWPVDPSEANSVWRKEAESWIRSPESPSIVKILQIGLFREHPALVSERVLGFRLSHLIRRRQQLSPAEILLVAGKLCKLLDDLGLDTNLRVHLDTIYFEFIDAPNDLEFGALMGRPVADWPAFRAKIFPMEVQEISRAVSLEAETILPEAKPVARRFGTIVYELLGGSRSLLRSGRYSPLASLNETANQTLREAIFRKDYAAPTRQEFLTRLERQLVPVPPVSTPVISPENESGDTVSGTIVRSQTYAIPERFLTCFTAGVQLGLQPESTAIPELWISAGARFHVGRRRSDVDLIAVFTPRNAINNERSLRIGKNHAVLEWMEGHLVVGDLSTNGTEVDERPIEGTWTDPFVGTHIIRLSGDYVFEITPFPSAFSPALPEIENIERWSGPKTSLRLVRRGAVQFVAQNSQPAGRISAWIQTDLVIGSGEDCALHAAFLPNRFCRIVYHHNVFWLQSLPGVAITLDDLPLSPEYISPLQNGMRISSGDQHFVVKVI